MAERSRSKRRKRKPAKKRPQVVKARKQTETPGVVEAALAVFAHEVRTPLTGILAISGLLATSDLGERERRWVDTIRAGAEHLASLATLFVDAAKDRKEDHKGDRRIGSGLREDLFDLRALARAAGDSLAGRAAAKGLQSRVEISPALPSLVIGDPVRLRAALENLIDNAAKFTEQGGVALEVVPASVAKGKAKGKISVAFAVSDSGIGLTLQEIKRLFRPFSQANVSIASRFGGVALTGTETTKAAVVNGGQEPVPEAVPPLRVLSVEDNPFGRVVLNTILNELGHQAEFIGRGEAATERIAHGSFDAVLMDMVLPGIDGVEAIRRIRALKPPFGRIAIIGVSGRDADEAASRAAGADAFLLKPVSPRALATALLEATRRAAAAT
jgi:CheY-like chemotaxis protein